jgi:hypothetical protein
LALTQLSDITTRPPNSMKTIKILFSVIFLAFTHISAQNVFIGLGATDIYISAGNVKNILQITNVNIKYDYTAMSVGKFPTEKEYLDMKMSEYEAEKAQKFHEGWSSSRSTRYEPKFELLFNKYGEAAGIKGTNYSDQHPITLIVKTTRTEPGFNAGVAKMPSYINVECSFVNAKGKLLLKYYLQNVTGANSFGLDFDMGSRLVESYAKTGKMLAKEMIKDKKRAK